MSTPIDDRRMLVADGSRVVMRNRDWSALYDAQGQMRWSDHPAGIPRNRWDPQAYEAAVVATCARIRANRVGRILIDELARRVTIIPFARHGAGNAFAHSGYTRGGLAPGERMRYCMNRASTPFDDTGRPIPNTPRGTGRGSATWVEFTPGGWSGVTAPGPGPWADEVLMHELVHALATTQGASSCRAAGFNYDTFDEYVAIAVTNVYCSHYRRPVRDSHQDRGPRPARVGQQRIDAEDEMMRDLYWLMGNFCDRLANLPESYASYNPFRDAAARGVIPRVTLATGGRPRISARQRVGR